jgi:hypothetical protein
MSKSRLAWAGGAIVLLLLLMVCGWYLKQHYCWGCTVGERYAQATELLCDQDVAERERGLRGMRKLANGGEIEALALIAELHLQPLPGRFSIVRQDLFVCAADSVTADRSQAIKDFRELARSEGLSPEMVYNLGVLVEDGLIDASETGSTAADYFRQAADRGEYRAMFELAKGEDQQKNYAKAAPWFKESFSRGGHPMAALMLGDYAFYGRVGVADVEMAVSWYQKALAAAQAPGADRIGRGIAQQVQNRLNIAMGHQQRSLGQGAPVVFYRLGGGPDEYLIFAFDSGELIGRVFRSGDLIQAVFGAGDALEGELQGREVLSMNKGLTWVLETHAAGLYGDGQKVRFTLASE